MKNPDKPIHKLDKADSFEQVFRTYYTGLHAYATKLLKDDELAEEVVQDMFYKLWERRKEVHIKGSIKSYLFRSVHNHCLNVFKHQKVRDTYRNEVESRKEELGWDSSDSMVALDIKEKIMEGIALLPPQCARIFRMNRLEGYKYREIAEQLGISQKTVEAQMTKAMRRMREHLKDDLSMMLILYLLG